VPDTDLRARWTTLNNDAQQGFVVVFDRCAAGERRAS
jgi:hypothetical protein